MSKCFQGCIDVAGRHAELPWTGSPPERHILSIAVIGGLGKIFVGPGTRWATLRFMPAKFRHSHPQPAFAGGKFTMGKPEDACSDTHILNQLLQGCCSASPGPIGVMLFQHSYPLPAFAGQVFWSQKTAAKQAPTLISLTSFCRTCWGCRWQAD